jgi:Ca-activated chloride channel family protein
VIHKPAKLISDSGAPVVLRSVKGRGRLCGLLLTMTLYQSFRNDEAQDIEVVYTFPLPWGAVLTGLEATLGERRMSGQVLARQQAAQRYEDAVEQGDAPVMVEKSTDGSFTASLGSLKPGELATVELSYAQVLNFEQGRVRLVVPTTIAPRYGDAVADGGLLPHHAAPPNLMAEYAFGIELTLVGALAQAQVSCPTHRMTQQTLGSEVRLTTGGDAWLDRDFVVLMEGLVGQSLVVAGPDPASGEGHCAVIASVCPRRPARPESPLALKILVDCSGSMSGDSIQQARAALRALVSRLQSQDRFTYSRFGSEPRSILSATPVTASGLQQLVSAIDATDADMGGTEMGAAFDHAFDLTFPRLQGGPEADVLVITDGAVWGVQNLLARASQSGHRIYALGVGSAPAESLLSEVAKETGGACEFVTPNEDMVAAMWRLLARMRDAGPVDTALQVKPSPLWCSPMPRRMTDDETVHVHMRLPAMLGGPPRLQFDGNAAAYPEITWLPDDLVARLVAARQISHTADETRASEIAERYQLVTDNTNLLLVFQRADAEKTDGMPSLRKVRPMLAAGTGGFGRVMTSAGRHTWPEEVMMRIERPSASSGAHLMMALRGTFDSEKFDIASHLRRQEALAIDAISRRLGAEHDAGSVTIQADSLMSGMTGAFDIVRIFNGAVRPGLSFRHVLRAVTEQTIDPKCLSAVGRAVAHAGTQTKSWACFLMWIHQMGASGARLSVAALDLVRTHVQDMDLRQIEATNTAFSAQVN